MIFNSPGTAPVLDARLCDLRASAPSGSPYLRRSDSVTSVSELSALCVRFGSLALGLRRLRRTCSRCVCAATFRARATTSHSAHIIRVHLPVTPSYRKKMRSSARARNSPAPKIKNVRVSVVHEHIFFGTRKKMATTRAKPFARANKKRSPPQNKIPVQMKNI